MDAPRDQLTRMTARGRVELRAAADGTKHLTGHFAVFNRMTEIHSWWEGNFREQLAPGAFARTFKQRAGQIRAIYEHGRDPMFGNKPLGNPQTLSEDDTGAFYDVALFDNELNRDYLVPAAEAGQLGASFAFDVLKETWEEEPDDGGLPIRTIQEVRLYEFGPCPFPAYADATAGVRAVLGRLDPRERAELARIALDLNFGTPRSGPATGTPPPGPAAPATVDPGDHSTATDPTAERAAARARQAVLAAKEW